MPKPLFWLQVHCSLTHWGWVTHICVSKLTIIGSDNGLSPGWRQAIIWTNDAILLIGALGTNFSEILIEIQTFSFWKNRLKVSSAKWRPFCLGLSELSTDVFSAQREHMTPKVGITGMTKPSTLSFGQVTPTHLEISSTSSCCSDLTVLWRGNTRASGQ